jgi:signal transduction histidine kinase/ligand-binding sensor domain-containing protein
MQDFAHPFYPEECMFESGRCRLLLPRLLVQKAVVATVGVFLAAAFIALAATWAASVAAQEAWSGVADRLFQRWYSLEQGLPHDIVTALAEDGQGFLWVGTQGGLARFDGYRFKVYRPDAHDESSLPDSYVETLHLDQAGRLWIGTSSGGLARYDAAHDRFVRYRAGKNALSNVAVRTLADDGNAGLWIATDGGLDRLDFKTDRITAQARKDGSVADKLLGGQIRALLRDRDGNLWFGTQMGGFARMGRDGHFQMIQLPIGKEPQSGITTLSQDVTGSIWVGTYRHGAFMIDPQTMDIEAVTDIGKNADSLSNDWVTKVLDLGDGRVWIGTFGHGLIEYDRVHRHFRRVLHDPMITGSLPNNSIMELFRSRAGMVWLGTHRGVGWHDPQQRSVLTLLGEAGRVHGISDVDVRTVLETRDGRVWLGLGSNGVDIFDPLAGKVGHLGIDPLHPQTALQKDRVNALAQLPDATVIIGSDRGLYRADQSGKQVARLEFSGRMPELGVRALFFDGQQCWVGGLTDGLWTLAADGSSLRRSEWSERLSNQRVTTMAQGSGGALWVGTRHGLNLLQAGQVHAILPQPGKSDGLPAGSIASMVTDRKGRLWVAMQGGGIAILLNQAQDGHAQQHFEARFQRLGLPEGLPDMNVNMVLMDQDGNIWASTDAGIASIDADSLHVNPLRLADGLHITGYWSGSGFASHDGQLLFGGANGLSVVQPGQWREWRYQPRVVLTDVRIKGKAVVVNRFNGVAGRGMPAATAHASAGAGMAVSSGARQSAAGAQIEPLLILPDANNLAVEFSALDYSMPELNRYAYRLDGYDQDWIDSDASRRLASYSNLPPGDYMLRLRGSNRNGVWAEERTLPLRVLPAWYQTWWFRILLLVTVLLLLAALTFSAITLRTRVLRHRQRQLELQIEKHTLQLREQQAELVQQAKLASLGTLTAGVAHEINNPANFALVGSYNMQRQLAEFHAMLLQLAGDEATPDFVQLLQRRFGELDGSLTAITEGATRIRDLVKDLRTFSRLEEADIKRVCITDSLRATLNLVRAQYADHMQIDCEFAANPELECCPVKLNQVFMNLIVNAYQAIAARAPELRAQVPGHLIIRSRLEGEILVFEFEDNGIGIGSESLPHIFDPFFTTKGVGQGMGMGLSIAFGIMEQHKGSISVTSVKGQGSCFGVRLLLQSGVVVES